MMINTYEFTNVYTLTFPTKKIAYFDTYYKLAPHQNITTFVCIKLSSEEEGKASPDTLDLTDM